ncbi:MAG TPA: beta-propeller fold lactonase family protein [Chitinophagaceae bacterium]|nr:beta-propeller fold lactonase family protein [Chitinophagaceae bacterium]
MRQNRFLPIAALSILFASCQKDIRDSMNEESAERSSISEQASEKGQAVGVVYTLSNQVSANEVLAYSRDVSGHLTFMKAYAAGGTGTGGGLGSQGAVILSSGGGWLIAVNAGSNSVSSFKVSGNGLQLTSTVSSGGTKPISVTEYNNIVFVLNAGGSGNISGFNLDDDGNLSVIANSTRQLSNSSADPAQISFTDDGHAVVVTEKANNKIITYTINAQGMPGSMHSIASATPTPFGFAVGQNGYIYVSEAAGGAPGASVVSSYHVSADGTITLVDGSVSAGQTAACWVVITNNDKYVYATNTGSGNISSFKNQSGDLMVLNAVAAPTGSGSAPIDAALSNNSKFLYTLNSGIKTISAFAVANDGSLSNIQTVTGLPDGATGLAAK